MLSKTTMRIGTLPIIAVALACVPRSAATPSAAADGDLEPGWNRIPGGADTGCSAETPFVFYARRGDPRRLMLYFQGGGACWNGANCDRRGRPTFDPQVDSSDDPARRRGLFDLENAANPVKDFTIVFVPYCTADVHLGARTVRYRSSRDSSRAFTIRHGGAANAHHALAWTYRHVAQPELVFVAGSSAGAIPSPVYAAEVARHYRRARVVQLGDGAGGYRAPSMSEIMTRWGATDALRYTRAYRALDTATVPQVALYTIAAREAPNVTFAQYNTARDTVQRDFLADLGMGGVPLESLLAANLADIRRANPAFRSYMAPGSVHTILLRDAFFRLTVDGVSLRDWVAALLDGRSVADVGDSLIPASR